MSKQVALLQGNEACALGAIYAGCDFFGGYPITPSTEVAEEMALMLPRSGGKFIQMEDEIAGIGTVLGAAAAGAKAMTATSGPGFSLMMELLGYGCMAELPCVIVNVQRGGPSTGLPTKGAQADMLQARWGTHGDHQAIALCPSSIEECFTQTVKCFNLAERFRMPVLLMMDEFIGHMREKMTIPQPGELETYTHPRPKVKPAEYRHFGEGTGVGGAYAAMGSGYRFNITGLTHDPKGFPTNRADETKWKMDRLRAKVADHLPELTEVEREFMDDAEIVIFSYGAAARTAQQAVREARAQGVKAGLLRPTVVWPFPDQVVTEALRQARAMVVAELNQGQMILEVERANRTHTRVLPALRYDGEMITPAEVMNVIAEAAR
ncbi:MAG TPA: 2-oxoacid:acceptor oxidoreductase subunit alpha [candidate division Zixibacteria bacterium]|nr:2-oxoacid:acceptor oxidoreductase subunit alpha [candidate division Zixibacteria bacterium]